MTKDQIETNYSQNLDILSLDDKSKDYKRSIQTGDFILDLSPEGDIRGVEVQNFSKIVDLDKEELQKISEVELQMDENDEILRITIKLDIKDQKTTLAAQLDPELQEA